MNKIIPILLILTCYTSLFAQEPPPPLLQPGEHWSQLYSVSYDFQTYGSIRYLMQDPSNPNYWCSIIMAQHDSTNAVGVNRFIYYSYSTNNGISWLPDVVDNSTSFGFPCITLSNGTVVIACHRSSNQSSIVYKDLLFGSYLFLEIPGVPTITGSQQPIWPHIAGTSNGNLVMAASPSGVDVGYRTTFNGSWSQYMNMNTISGGPGNFDVSSGPNGEVSIFGTNPNFNNFLSWYRSSDNGITFDNGTVIFEGINDNGDYLSANIVGGYQSVYDNSGVVHLVFTVYKENINAIFPSQYTGAYIKPRIYHWSSLTNNLTQVAGNFNIPNLIDTITQFAFAPIGQPTITRTTNGNLMCAFTACLRGNTQVVDNGNVVNAGEIFYCVSDDNGVSWSEPVNITNTPGIEEKYPSFSPNTVQDSLKLFYLRDMKAGAWSSVPQWGKAPVYGIFNNFNFNQAPVAPVLQSPSNNSNLISVTPLLDWEYTFNANSYIVQISSDSNFSNLILDANVSTSEYSVPDSILNYDSLYFWRVNASNSSGTGDWSSIWNFRTISLIPPAPVLFSPVNGAVNINLTPLISWDSSFSAAAYNLQISGDSNFTSLVIDQMNITNTLFSVPPSILSINTKYFWRVNALNINGTGQWSSVWNFTTYDGILPPAPILISPPDASSNISLTPVLDWEDVSGSVSYRVEVAIDLNFNSIIFDDSTITSSQITIPSPILGYNNLYFWRVNSKNIVGSGPWSTVWDFRTRLKTGISQTSDIIPTEYDLFNNYPNPFNPSTNLEFGIPKLGITSLKVYDVAGKEVAVLVNEVLAPGIYIYQFSTVNYQLSSGIYLYRLESGGFVETKRMILLK